MVRKLKCFLVFQKSRIWLKQSQSILVVLKTTKLFTVYCLSDGNSNAKALLEQVDTMGTVMLKLL